MNYLTNVSKELSNIEDVSNLKESVLKNKNKTRGAHRIDFEYGGFPLSALEILEDSGIRFTNLRLVISYPRDKYPMAVVHRVVNDFNANGMCLKAFYIDDNSDNKNFDIAYNFEYVSLDGGAGSSPDITMRIDMLIRAPLEVHKQLDEK